MAPHPPFLFAHDRPAQFVGKSAPNGRRPAGSHPSRNASGSIMQTLYNPTPSDWIRYVAGNSVRGSRVPKWA